MPHEVSAEKVSVNINTSTLAQIDLLVDNGYYSNRSDFINQALREGIQKHQKTLDRIIDGSLGKSKPDQWFVGVMGLDSRVLAEMASGGGTGSVTGYGVLVIDEKLTDEEIFSAVTGIRVKGKVVARRSVKDHYGIK